MAAGSSIPAQAHGELYPDWWGGGGQAPWASGRRENELYRGGGGCLREECRWEGGRRVHGKALVQLGVAATWPQAAAFLPKPTVSRLRYVVTAGRNRGKKQSGVGL